MEIGVDIVDHTRVNMKVSKKILTKNENIQMDNITQADAKKEYLCSRIAAKEAIIKATNKKYGFRDIEVLRTDSGPKVNIKGIKLSLSHEKSISVAFCIYDNKGE